MSEKFTITAYESLSKHVMPVTQPITVLIAGFTEDTTGKETMGYSISLAMAVIVEYFIRYEREADSPDASTQLALTPAGRKKQGWQQGGEEVHTDYLIMDAFGIPVMATELYGDSTAVIALLCDYTSRSPEIVARVTNATARVKQIAQSYRTPSPTDWSTADDEQQQAAEADVGNGFLTMSDRMRQLSTAKPKNLGPYFNRGRV